jgi:hypothetical protein
MLNSEIPQPNKKLSALKSIKFYCKNLCCAGDTISWKNCTAERCVLWRYRLGVGNKLKTKNKSEKIAIN